MSDIEGYRWWMFHVKRFESRIRVMRVDRYDPPEPGPKWVRLQGRIMVKSHTLDEIVTVDGVEEANLYLERYDRWVYPRKDWKRASDSWINCLLANG